MAFDHQGIERCHQGVLINNSLLVIVLRTGVGRLRLGNIDAWVVGQT